MGTTYSIDKKQKGNNESFVSVEEKIKYYKKSIHAVFNHKRISRKAYASVIEKLNFLSKHDPYFFDFNMGKFLTTFSDDYETAIEYLDAAKQICPESAGAHYQLYKCFVRTGDYHNALNSLYDCRDLVDKKYGKYDNEGNLTEDFNLPIKMLYALLDIEECYGEYCERDYTVKPHSKHCFSPITDSELLSTYTEVIDAFNERNYDECLNKINVMNNRINAIDYEMEVETLAIIANGLIENIKFYGSNQNNGQKVYKK